MTNDHFGGSEERLIDYELFYRHAQTGKVWHNGVRNGEEFEEPLTGADVELNWLQKPYEPRKKEDDRPDRHGNGIRYIGDPG